MSHGRGEAAIAPPCPPSSKPSQHTRAHHFPLSIYDLFLKHHINPSLREAVCTTVLLASTPFEEIFPQIPLLPLARPWRAWNKELCPGAAAATCGTWRYHPKLECVRWGENKVMDRSREAEQLQAVLLSSHPSAPRGYCQGPAPQQRADKK